MGLLELLPKSVVFSIHRRNYSKAAERPAEIVEERVRNTVEALQRDGTVVIPVYWDRLKALELGDALNPKALDIITSTAPDKPKFVWMPDSETLRVMDPKCFDERVNEFFGDPFIKAVAAGFTSHKIMSWQRMYETRSAKPFVGSADAWHIDEAFYFKFKAFLYLSDVTPETAPYMYLKSSHQQHDWRGPMEEQILTHDLYGASKVHGLRGNYIDARQVNFLKKKYGYTEMVCTGPAGSLVLTTTNGLHKATTPMNGGRRMLGHYYELPRASIWPKTRKNG